MKYFREVVIKIPVWFTSKMSTKKLDSTVLPPNGPIWSLQLGSHSKRRMQQKRCKSIFLPNKANSFSWTQKTTKIRQNITKNAWKDLQEYSCNRYTSQFFYYHFSQCFPFYIHHIDREMDNIEFQTNFVRVRLFLPDMPTSGPFLALMLSSNQIRTCYDKFFYRQLCRDKYSGANVRFEVGWPAKTTNRFDSSFKVLKDRWSSWRIVPTISNGWMDLIAIKSYWQCILVIGIVSN